MLKQGEILTLSDNNKYSIVCTAEHNGKNYVYLIQQDDYSNVMFCEYNNEELTEVTDAELFASLMLKFKEQLDNEV